MKKRRIDIEINTIKTVTEKDIYNMLMEFSGNELFDLAANVVNDLDEDSVPKNLRESVVRFLVDTMEDGDIEELYLERNE